ncbi:ClpX C4-type zinc finger protein [Polyangium jinanense]|uniref:ClpX C4-type zinc finger protein n=1 Tax=Polyangium jinanense TaxID=2829994 RepID=A0A9X3XH43_9BACT|nr:ClpX C4-type zinc finger protein [Polyangium jinanense]MDC3988001.1 ClpX C4-type zinc finger protein [Polyangium jinanense]
MSLPEEIAITEEVVQAARDAAVEHLQRAKEDLHLESAAGSRYEDFLNATLRTAESTLAHCQKIMTMPGIHDHERTPIVQGITGGVRESVRAMYVVMALVEHLAGPEGACHARQGEIARTDALRTCSFCGRSEAQAKLAAGPAVNICETCARLVCGVLGLRLLDTEPR